MRLYCCSFCFAKEAVLACNIAHIGLQYWLSCKSIWAIQQSSPKRVRNYYASDTLTDGVNV